MRLSMKALVVVSAILWGGGVLLVGLIHLAAPSYGADLLREMSSVYPGFHAARSLGDVVTGMVYGLVDGAIAGLLFGWLYNHFAGRPRQA